MTFEKIMEFVNGFKHREKVEKRNWIFERVVETKFLKSMLWWEDLETYNLMNEFATYKSKSVWRMSMKIAHWHNYYKWELLKYYNEIYFNNLNNKNEIEDIEQILNNT